MNVALNITNKMAEETIILSPPGDDVNPLLTTPLLDRRFQKKNPQDYNQY